VHVSTAKMLFQIFLSRESSPRTSVAVRVRTHSWRLGLCILLVYLALVTQQTTGISEATDFVAAWLFAFVRPVMLVHMFTTGEKELVLDLQIKRVFGSITYFHSHRRRKVGRVSLQPA
jgi:hypothetical protein